ncbi:hypothetical protein [Streptosporangium canum]|uniref:hypothetical protein n=1 Tax=Streptosporangium canum TaxID=324952 RepID=UPI0037BD020A
MRIYAELLEWPIVHEEPGTAVVAPPQGAVYIVFQQATGYRPPAWPPVDGEQRPTMPLDFQVGDPDEATAEPCSGLLCFRDGPWRASTAPGEPAGSRGRGGP